MLSLAVMLFHSLLSKPYYMPKVATVRPEVSCSKYLFSKKSVHRYREGGVRKRCEHCENCFKVIMVSHEGCTGKVAQGCKNKSITLASHGRCAEHVSDPAYCVTASGAGAKKARSDTSAFAFSVVVASATHVLCICSHVLTH